MADVGAPVMVRLLLALVLAVSGLLVAGCGKDNMGQSDSNIEKESQAWKSYNETKLKDNPPPPGEGPSN